MPSLIATLEVTSLMSNNVSLMVDVNEQSNCDGLDGLTINANIMEGDKIISSKMANFTNITITFLNEMIPPGDFICSITIEDETGPIESSNRSCAIISELKDTNDFNSELYVTIMQVLQLT